MVARAAHTALQRLAGQALVRSCLPAAFPWAESVHYWTQHVADLQHQWEELHAAAGPVLSGSQPTMRRQ